MEGIIRGILTRAIANYNYFSQLKEPKFMEPFLTSERLAFRELIVEDLDFLHSLLSDPEVVRFYPYVFDRAGALEWLEKGMARQQRDGYSFWLVADKRTGEAIGQAGLLKQEVDGEVEAEIGYMLAKNHWRNGYAREAAVTIRDYAFNQLGKQRVISLIRPANIPSQRVALSYGAKPEKLVLWRDYEHLVFALNRPASEMARISYVH
jgi:ribosomal-protein-alanine N-acetyltransferase